MIVSRLFQEAFRELRVQRLGASFRRLLDMLYRGSPAEAGVTPRVVLLTPARTARRTSSTSTWRAISASRWSRAAT